MAQPRWPSAEEGVADQRAASWLCEEFEATQHLKMQPEELPEMRNMLAAQNGLAP